MADEIKKSTAAKLAMFLSEELGADAKIQAWSSAPGFKIGNFAVYPLSLRSMVDLRLAGNAFFTGSQILHGDIAAYIWRHLPEYDLADPDMPKNQKRFLKAIAKELDSQSIIEGIQGHIEAAFADALPEQTLPATVTEYAAAFGLEPYEAAYTDLRIVFQTVKTLRNNNLRIQSN